MVLVGEWKEGAGSQRSAEPRRLNAPDRLKKSSTSTRDKPLLTATVEAKSTTLAPFDFSWLTPVLRGPLRVLSLHPALEFNT